MDYAGFWKRFAAYLVDFVVVFFGSFVIGFGLGFALAISGESDPDIFEAAGNVAGFLGAWVYSAAMESSGKQGTLGKMALGIKVTDMEGARIGFGRATGRHFGKIVSAIILLVGFLMIAFTKKKQGLHDMMAGCLVVNK